MTRASLRPCSACARHSRATEEACPFCGAPTLAYSERDAAGRNPAGPSANLSRAALFAFRAAVGAGTLGLAPGCSSPSEPPPPGGPETDSGPDATFVVAPPYGLPPPPPSFDRDACPPGLQIPDAAVYMCEAGAPGAAGCPGTSGGSGPLYPEGCMKVIPASSAACSGPCCGPVVCTCEALVAVGVGISSLTGFEFVCPD